MGRLVLLMALLPIVVQGASLEDRAVEAMKLVDISDRAIDDWWKTFTTMWNTYDTKISAKPTLACTDWENLLKELGEIKTQIGLVEDGLKALKAQLVAIRQILEHATWGTTSGLHCQKTPEEPICKALKELDDLADEKQKRLDGEKKIVDDEITRIKTYDCNCTWKQWAGDWGKCSKTCEEGIQTEKRTILWNVRNNGVPCNPADATRTAACDEGCCPVDCKWNDWEKWGECPNVCSADTQYRRRVRSKAQTMMCESRGGQRCIGGPNDKEECKILEVWDKRIDGLKEKHAGLQKQINLYKEKLCDPNPCANGGSCNEGACTCKGDWTGYHCKVNSAPKPKPQPGLKKSGLSLKKSGGPVNIERKGLVKTLDQWGPEFKIRFDIKLKQDLPKSWLNFLHLTTGENCCGGGSRLPGIWFRNANVKGKFGNTMMVAQTFQKGRRQVWTWISPQFEINRWYSVELEQREHLPKQYEFTVKVDGKLAYKLGPSNLKGYLPSQYANVELWMSDKWYPSLSGLADVKNLVIEDLTLR